MSEKSSGFNQFDPKYDLRCDTDARVDYVLCSAPRSGGHYLGHLMYSTLSMGYPLEYFNPDHLARWAALSGSTDCAATFDYIRSRRTSANGCFGVKADFSQFALAMRDCHFPVLFPRCQFILVERRDLLGQAISLVRARQTNQWISLHQPAAEAKYVYAEINAAMISLLEEQASWQRYLAAMGQEYLEVTYEALVAEPVKIIDQIAAYLGIAPVQVRFDLVLPQKQADSGSDQWREQFQREAKVAIGDFAYRGLSLVVPR